MAGWIFGGSGTIPIWDSIFLIMDLSVMADMSFIFSPQDVQVSTSIENTRLSNAAQDVNFTAWQSARAYQLFNININLNINIKILVFRLIYPSSPSLAMRGSRIRIFYVKPLEARKT